MDRLQYFLSEFNTQGRRVEKDVTVLGRPWTFRFRSISQDVLVWLSLNFTHNTSMRSSLAFWCTYLTYFWFSTMTHLDVLTHFVSGAFRFRKLLGRLQSYCTYMISKVPSCAISGFLTLKLTHHFDLIYNIGKSDWNILLNIMKTAQDSYTITMKQIVRFQERMHLENYQLNLIQNGRLSAIIYVDRPFIG